MSPSKIKKFDLRTEIVGLSYYVSESITTEIVGFIEATLPQSSHILFVGNVLQSLTDRPARILKDSSLVAEGRKQKFSTIVSRSRSAKACLNSSTNPLLFQEGSGTGVDQFLRSISNLRSQFRLSQLSQNFPKPFLSVKTSELYW